MSQWLLVRWIAVLAGWEASQCRFVHRNAALAGWERPKWLGLVTRTSLIGIISVKLTKKRHIFLPLSARNFIFVSEFVFFYADKYGLHLN